MLNEPLEIFTNVFSKKNIVNSSCDKLGMGFQMVVVHFFQSCNHMVNVLAKC
jgi:hypothetical protein